MKKILLLSFLLCLCTVGFAQVYNPPLNTYAIKLGKKEFLYGTLVSEQKNYTGYFWFDSQINQMGQRILFKQNKESKKKVTFYAKDFDSFRSDSLHLKTFVVPILSVGKVSVMLPRVVSGDIELYNCRYAGYYSFVKTDHFFLSNGGEMIQLTKRKFIEQMKYLVGTDFALMERIEKKELKYDDLPQIIYTFNN